MRFGFLVLLVIAGCETPCTDHDGDGYGVACAPGADCDDDDASRNVDCETIPPPDCEADPADTGCPCLPGAVEPCFSIEGAIAGAGRCRAGRALCRSSHWGLCNGVVGPSVELCNAIDDDCDGRVDEGTRSPCGGCRDDCRGGVWGETSDPFVATSELALTTYGQLTLARTESASVTLWVANSAEGTVSRIDGATMTETARYPSRLAARGLDDAAPEPSRVAVDWAGDAWVANRTFDGQGSVTKIAGDLARCVDRDGDGTIETSTGPLDVRADDECVLFTVLVGGDREVPRALAIDGGGLDGVSAGNAWVGLFEGHAVVELDGRDGHELRHVMIDAFSPYGAAVDPWGTIWMMSRDGYLARIDPRSEVPSVEMVEVPLACWLLYSIAIDAEGRIALTGFSCDQVSLYEPGLGSFSRVATEPSTRGAVFTPDGALWVAHTGGLVTELGVAPLHVRRTVDLQAGAYTPTETIGMGVDTLGHVYAVSRDGGDGGNGLVSRIDLPRGDVGATVTTGRAPHTQGDLTGVMLGGEFVDMGSESHVFLGCDVDGPTMWRDLHVEADAGATGTITVEARHAADVSGLDAAAFAVVGVIPGSASPFPLAFPDGGVVEVRVTLSTSSRLGAPRVARVGLEWRCSGPD
jgi:streptogramin lyase